MKKILRNLSLCFCLIFVGLLCFNAKPKASIFGSISTTYNLFPSDYEETSYTYAFVISDSAINSTGSITMYFFDNNVNYGRNLLQITDSNNIIYYDFINNSTHQQLINNNETSFYMLLISNNFSASGDLFWIIQLVQYDYSIPFDINDDSTILNPYTTIYSYILIADEITSLIIPSTFSLYYIEYAETDQINQSIGTDNYTGELLFFFVWNFYNSTYIGDFAPYMSTFYNYSLEEFNKGVDEGLELGFDLGVASIENIPGTFLSPIFDFIDNVFNLEVMPNVKIGYFIIIPLVFGVLGVVLYFWRKD